MTSQQFSPHSRCLRTLCALLATLSLSSAAVSTASSEPAHEQEPIFRFTTDSFWLNLHHFLYVLGRAEAQMPDIERRAVAQAPDDQERGLATLPPEQQQLWRQAVSTYAQGPSQLSVTFDEELFTASRRLAKAGDSLAGVELEPTLAAALQQAAPIYRQVWWPEHQAANQTWVEAIEPLLEKHGQPVLNFITKASGLPWPADGFPVQMSGYSNWAGAYSTEGPLLVLSSLDPAFRGTSVGLETVFHEAMHQWDEANFEALVAAAKARRVRFPQGLDHAMLFFTVGEAFRTVIPEHIPYAHQFGVWQRRSGKFLPMLEKSWRPYLHGLVPRNHALANLMHHFENPPSSEGRQE